MKVPRVASHVLGIRDGNDDAKRKKSIPQWRISVSSFLGSFIGIAILAVLFRYSSYFHTTLGVPVVLSCWGAAAILVYGAPQAPMAQPRAVFLGSLISSSIGVAISKLFLQINTPATVYEDVRWVAAAASVALSLVAMQVTKSVHPPGGAIAMSCMAQEDVMALGWYYIGYIMLAATLMFVWALLINNIDRQYPIYWWTPTRQAYPDLQATHGNSTSTATLSADTFPDIQDLPQDMLDANEKAVYTKIRQKLQTAFK